jgi:hypothetical protein
MEHLCQRCRRLFHPTEESLVRGSPYWWYCRACEREQRWATMRNQHTVAQGGAGAEPQRVAAELKVLKRTPAKLGPVVADLERTPTH